MGTWAAGSFGNDSAGDWIIDLLENPSYAFLEETLRASIEDLDDSMLNANAIAAAEVVSIISSGIKPKDFEPVSHNLAPAIKILLRQTMPVSIKKLALKAIETIEQDSEMKELWEGDEDWVGEIEALKKRLKKPFKKV